MSSMRKTLCLLLFIPLAGFSYEEFSIEDNWSSRDVIPASVVSDLRFEIDLNESGCLESNVRDTLESSQVQLSPGKTSLIVKPKSWCLCGAYYCPVWIYAIRDGKTRRIWSTKGTSSVEILDKSVNGYRQIRESGGTAGHSYMRLWGWDGKKYKLIKEKYSVSAE